MSDPARESPSSVVPSSGEPLDFLSRRIRLALFVLVAATLAAYANSFGGPFVFDDKPAILANPTLKSFSAALFPPVDGGTVSGRPLVNLSLALNHAISGTAVWSYHAFNVAIHLLAVLTLFGLVRRTVLCRASVWQPPSDSATTRGVCQTDALRIAFTIALLWSLHPLQTESVTYIVQRAESLCGLFVLLTLYCFARATVARAGGPVPVPAFRSRLWFALSFAACLAGMASKEVMAVAPLLVLLYDRTFVAGEFSAALRGRPRYYAALAATWLPLAWLVAANSARAGTAGFGGSASPWPYLLTQCDSLVTYLRLSVWPHPLVFDYGTTLVRSPFQVWWQAFVVLALLGLALWALVRKPRGGFFGVWFFLLLAPSSSVVPIATQTAAEHRMYLPLAAVAVGVALALHAWLGRRALLGGALLALPLGIFTARRNADYRSELILWADTAQKLPANPRARLNHGGALIQAGRRDEALVEFAAAERLAPADADAAANLATALHAAGRTAEALPHFESAVRLNAASPPARLGLAQVLLALGRPADALAHFAAAHSLRPLDADARCNYGVAQFQAGRVADAIASYREALRLQPDFAKAHYNLGNAHLRNRALADATAAYREAVRCAPDYLPARVNLGNSLLLAGRAAEAITEYEAALRLRPDDATVRANLARARALAR